MDPTVTYLAMFEAMRDENFTEAREHALNLKEWLDKGGFYPQFYTELEVNAYLKSVLRRTGG